jgi:hypothetical protein
VFNPRFLPGGPPPPFNWRFTSGGGGVAEPQPGGGLRVLYYGREDVVLAQQLLMLAPGRYQLRQDVATPAANLHWTLTCLPGGTRLDAVDAPITVPPACTAQRLELRGTMPETSATTDVLIRSVTLVPANGR